MSTLLRNTNGEELQVETPHGDFTCAVVCAQWNPEITDALLRGAVDTLNGAITRAGLAPTVTESTGRVTPRVQVYRVPGTVELVNAAAAVIRRRKPSAVIILGCVIRGDTPHFDYVCQHTAQGAAIINARGETPLIFGVITVNTLQQAQERAGGALGNKGSEAAAAAIAMANLHSISNY